jgi:hypothetical protein
LFHFCSQLIAQDEGLVGFRELDGMLANTSAHGTRSGTTLIEEEGVEDVEDVGESVTADGASRSQLQRSKLWKTLEEDDKGFVNMNDIHKSFQQTIRRRRRKKTASGTSLFTSTATPSAASSSNHLLNYSYSFSTPNSSPQPSKQRPMTLLELSTVRKKPTSRSQSPMGRNDNSGVWF